MLSKEEIEKAKEDLTFFNEGDYITKEMSDSKNVLFEHIWQLESDKQKLIEKLEKVKQKDEEWNALNGELAVWTFAQEILSILKGE